MPLQKKSLGNTDIELSQIGLGTVKFGRGVDANIISDEELVSFLNLAAKLGINYLDTAPCYGNAESRLGELLPYVDGNFKIITKVGQIEDPEQGKIYNFDQDSLCRSLEQSFKRLKRDVIDVVLLHSDGKDKENISAGALNPLIDAKEQGLVKAFGLSGKTIEGGQIALDLGAECLMITLNTETDVELPLTKLALEKGAGVLIKKPLGGGRLVEGIHEQFQNLMSNPGITSITVGTTNQEHLKYNCKAFL